MSQADGDVPGALQMWAGIGGGTLVQLREVRGACVVAITGRLDVAALQPCRAALDAATDHERPIIVDLERVAPPSQRSACPCWERCADTPRLAAPP